MRLYFVLLLSGLAYLLLTAPASGQDELILDLEEDYSGRVKVSGSVIVGAVFGELDGRTDPRNLKVRLEPEAGMSTLCFSATTRDGQYSARAKVGAPGGLLQNARLVPAKDWSFLPQLRKYNRTDYAPIIRLGESCEIEEKAMILPVIVGDGTRDKLTFFINSQRAIRLTASIPVPGEAPVEADCQNVASIEFRSTAFNYACRFSLEGRSLAGAMQVNVNRLMRVGRRLDVETVYLPSN